MRTRSTSTRIIRAFDSRDAHCTFWTSQTGRSTGTVILASDQPVEALTARIHALDLPDFSFAAVRLDSATPANNAVLLQLLFEHLSESGARRIIAYGHQHGGFSAALWVHDYAPALAALIVEEPSFCGDTEALRRLQEDAGAIIVPTLLLAGEDMQRHDLARLHDLHEGLGSRIKHLHDPAHSLHDRLETEAGGRQVRRFIAERCAGTDQPVSLLDADHHGHTAEEYERLSARLHPLSPRGLYWALNRAGIAAGSWLSEGLRLGQATGFDSGSMLDYVHRNEARGKTALGRMIDRAYLDAIGWRGIRQRKLNLEVTLADAAARLKLRQQPVRLLDIAAGHGRYILDAMKAMTEPPEQVRLRDFSPLNVEAGQKLIAERNLTGIASFERGDAFDEQALASLEPPEQKSTLSVVSGLYELFPDNGMVRRSLAGVAAATQKGGYLVYTGQPWHPQIEAIARALTSHRDGAAWAMRRRVQAEMDQLVEVSGFRKLTQRADPWGIFTVSLAQKQC